MLIRQDLLQRWRGERLSDGILYPKNIEALWSVVELSAVGLVKEIPFIMPEGFHRTGPSSWLVDGTEVIPTEAIPAPTPEEVAAQKQTEVDDLLEMNRVLNLVLFELYNMAKVGPPANDDEFRTWVESL